MVDNAWEDIGYNRGDNMDQTYVLRENKHLNSIRVEFMAGINSGKIQWIRSDLAEDLIRRKVAREYGQSYKADEPISEPITTAISDL